MPRRPRRMSASGIYHVMIRGINKMQIFNDDADNIQFLHFLEFTQTDEFQILAYCLMGNHAHLLIRTSKTGIEPLEAGMKSLCIRYAAYYNRKYERIGTLFQDRYKSQPVTTVGYFCAYCATSIITRWPLALPIQWPTTLGAATATTLQHAALASARCTQNMPCRLKHMTNSCSGIQKQKSTPAAYLMLTIQKVKSVTRRLTISSRYLPGCPLRSCSGCRKKSKHKCSNA